MSDFVLAQAKVERELRDEVSVILDDLGLDIPTAIRIYLKFIAREKGLPFQVRLTPASLSGPGADPFAAAEARPAEDGGEPAGGRAAPDIRPVVMLPGIPEKNTVPVDMFVQLICRVPAGQLTRWQDMERWLTKQYGYPVKRTLYAKWPKTLPDGTDIPYWRVISPFGVLRDDRACSRDLQEEMLRKEGLSVIARGTKFDSIRVERFMNYLTDFTALPVREAKALPL